MIRETYRTYCYHFGTGTSGYDSLNFDTDTFARFYFGSAIFAMKMIGRAFAQIRTEAAIADTVRFFFHCQSSLF
jgi:hypothetical protein